MNLSFTKHAHLLPILLLAISQVEAEERLFPGTNTALIDSAAMSHSQGIVGLNQAAGANNLQSNLRGIGINQDGASSAVVATSLSQTSPVGPRMGGQLLTEARVASAAFVNSIGILSVNQVAGVGNNQGNLINIGSGHHGEVLSDRALSDSLALTPQTVLAEHRSRDGHKVSIDGSAFTGTKGIVQLNQTAGTGNQSANLLGVRIVAEPRP